MRTFFQRKLSVLAMCLSLFTLHAVAQESVAKNNTEKSAVINTAPAKTNSTSKTESSSATNKALANKKMVQDATISLQTTITGNQEQPKVLYILPWQSPLTEQVDFEPLDNQQKAVFNHVERDELRRELEVAGELQ